MALLISFDPSGVDPKVVSALDDIIASVQTWAGTVDGIGRWVDIPFSAGIYSSLVGTWTVVAGNHSRFRYCLVGAETMCLEVYISATTTSAGMGTELLVRLPDGFTVKPNARGIQDAFNLVGVCQYNSGATSGIGLVWGGGTSAQTQLRLVRDMLSPSTSWPSGVADLSIGFLVTIPVVRT